MMKRRQYTEEFKREAVRLSLEPGQTKAQVARDLDLSESVLYRWVERYGATPSGRGAAVSGDERAELVQIRRVFSGGRGSYGIRRVHAAFSAEGSSGPSRNRVARLMRAAGLGASAEASCSDDRLLSRAAGGP